MLKLTKKSKQNQKKFLQYKKKDKEDGCFGGSVKASVFQYQIEDRGEAYEERNKWKNVDNSTTCSHYYGWKWTLG